MINVSETAREQVKAYFEGKEVQPVRIFLNSGGCGGPSLAMALDEKKEDDAVFTHDGIDYIMEKSLMKEASPVEVNFSGMGFRLDSSLKLGGGCSSCGSTGSCCE
ncbi:IscA/HesB family protein [Desulfospira joergensenii]|uniref:IscA/HesB family protein n=1 Tax=Desulfospira joergensenii TaxID=53329 RepID=UPI0003B672BC|nr:IscA/HesB family protein [Desulfospira joergensenii]